MSTVTEFGKLVRKLRIERDETMVDMGLKIGKSASFLSAMETGRKSVPVQVVDAIGAAYGLSVGEVAALRESAALNGHTFRLEPSTEGDRELVAAFAARYDSLNEGQRQAIWSALNGEIAEL